MKGNLNFDIKHIRRNDFTAWYCVDAKDNNIEAWFILGFADITKYTVIVIGVNSSIADEKNEDATIKDK